MEAATRFESYVEVLRHLREPLVIASRSGRILAANAAAAEALGTSIEALENSPLAGHSPDPAGLGARLGVRSFQLRARDGHRFSCEASPLALDMLLVRFSGSPEAAPRVHALLEAIYRLHGITACVSDRQALPELCRALLSQGMSAVGAISGGVFLIDEGGANLELKGSIGYDDESADRFRLVPLAAPLPLTDSVKEAVTILLGATADYVARYPDLAKTHPIHGLSAAACVPLEVEGRVIGTLGLGFPLPWTFEDEDREYLLAFADQCALALARAIRVRPDHGSRALAERAARHLERLQEFTRTLAQAITPAQVTEAVVDAGVAAASARAGGLWLLSEDGATVCLERGVGQGWPLAEDHASVPLDGEARLPILDAIRSGTPVWLESCRQHQERYPALKALPQGRDSSLACIPVSVRGRCVGGLSLHYEGVRSFVVDERAFLQMLSWHAAQAIEWSRLFAAEKAAREAAEASQRASEFLADAGTLLSSSLDYTSTLAGVALAAVPRFADWCIVELEEERLRGQPPVAAHVDPSKVPFVLELSRRFRALGEGDHGIPGVIRTGKSRLYSPLTLERLRDYPALLDLYGESGLVASMVVPISARGRTLGAILLNSTNPARVYDERDLAMAEELGRRAGLAVDNARLYRDATQAERLKDEFLATLGHELRNPLAPIVSAMDLMNLQGGDAFKRERAVISRHLEHVVRLVDDLLDVARITRDEFQLDKERCEVSQVIARAVEMVSARAGERARRFTLQVPPSGLPVMADAEKLAQAFANLLSNAVKYTDSAGTITVSALSEGDQAVIRVRDTGMGIAPEMLSRVFDLFSQGKTALDRGQSGLGIGLTVVKRLVSLHDGSVSAHSGGLGRGSEFVVRLPLAYRHGSEASVSEVPSSGVAVGRGAQPLRVLIVDDNADAAETLSATLGLVGVIARTANDGESALTAAEELEPHLAILDIGLPLMDGYEVARRLRALRVPPVMVVAVTGFGQESDYRRSREAGFDDHFVKPIGVDAIHAIVMRCRDAIAATG